MDITPLIELALGSQYLKELSLVAFVIISMRSSIGGIKSELFDLKAIFREYNKRLSSVEGKSEAHDYMIYELKTDVKQLKKGD